MAQGKLVLVADDFDDLAEVYAELIDQLPGFEAVAVKDGAKALQACTDLRPAVALLDIDMPLLDGVEVARRVKHALGDAAPVLIAQTGGVELARAKASGFFDHVLAKPVDFERLIEVLEPLAATK